MRTFQEPEVFESFSVGETCELICRTAARRQNLNEALPATAEELLEACGLSEVAAAPVAILPYGQLRLLGVAAAIACRPHLLLLDEPAAGLAPNDATALRNVILHARDRGVTVVVIDHDMSFLLPLCDRVTVLDGGCKLAEGESDAVADDPSVIAAYLGERFATKRAAALAETGSKA